MVNRKFEIALPVLVQGMEEETGEFVEQTVVSTINAEEAVLHLKTKVAPGMKLRMSLHVPRTFLLEKPLHLDLTGIVASTTEAKTGRRTKQAVRIRLDRAYHISCVPA